MRKLILMTAFTLLFVATAVGQRGGMRGGGGGMRGGGGGAIGNGPRGGFGGGSNWMGGHTGGNGGGSWGGSGWNHGGFFGRAGIRGNGFYNAGFQPAFYGYGAGFGYTYPYAYSYPSWGLGLGYSSWPGFYDGSYNDSPNVVVVYPQQAAAPAVTTVYTELVKPVMHEYEFEAQTQTESPVYLFAFKDQSIRAAASYRIEAGVLHYTTLDRQEKQASLDTLDRELSLRLNRQRKVTLELPQ